LPNRRNITKITDLSNPFKKENQRSKIANILEEKPIRPYACERGTRKILE